MYALRDAVQHEISPCEKEEATPPLAVRRADEIYKLNVKKGKLTLIWLCDGWTRYTVYVECGKGEITPCLAVRRIFIYVECEKGEITPYLAVRS